MPNTAEQHVAAVTVAIDGQELSPELRSMVTEVRVRDSLTLPATAVVRLTDARGQKVDDDLFKIGKELEVKAGALGDTGVKSIFKGEVVAFEPEFSRDGVKIAIRAYDKSHRMQRARKVRTFQDMSASDIIKKVLGDYPLTADVESTSFVYKFFQQSGETDRELIARFERLYDCNFFVHDGTASFKKADGSGGPTVNLKYGEGLTDFRPRVSAAQQVDSVEYRGWDPAQKAEVVGTASDPITASSIGTSRDSVAGAFGSHKVLVSDRTLEATGEANALAKSALTEMGDAFLEAEGSSLGNPDLRAGRKVKIDGVGSKLGGTYLLSSVDHVYRGTRGYKTHFQIAGKSDRSLLDLVHKPEQRRWGQGLVVGLVTNVNDPDDLGRVRVKFPALISDTNADVESYWARVVTPAAGDARGLLMLPRVDDEVVVAFENDDVRRPLVVGAVFNGKDKPGDELLARKDGSYAMLSDEQSLMHTKKDMTFKSDENLVIEVQKDQRGKAGGDYKQESGGSSQLKAGSSYTIEAGSSMTIKGVSMSIEASGSLTLKGATVSIEASGMTSIKGSMINLG